MRDYLYNLATDKYRGFIPGIIKFFLLALSFIYRLILTVLFYFSRLKAYRLNCRVISVGNITLGGTGKTTLVEYIAEYLKKHGHKVAVLSRGSCVNQVMTDEPRMLQMNLKEVPVIVNRNRIRAAQQAISEYGVDAIVLDDGFQQWRIKKDLEIVAVDATAPFGNSHLLPRGTLREPVSSLKRADILVLTKTNLNPDIQGIIGRLTRINPDALIVESIHRPLGFYELGKKRELLGPVILKGQSVTLVSGIGDPDSFENLAAVLGMRIGLSFRFADHHLYSQGDIDMIIRESQQKNISTIVTTEKDAMRFSVSAHAVKILVLRISLEITKNEQEFNHRLLGLYSL